MGGILLVAIWEMCCGALDQWRRPDGVHPAFWIGVGVLAATLLAHGFIYDIKRRSPRARFLSRWMALAPLVTLLSMTGFLPSIPVLGEVVAVWAIGSVSLVALVLLVRECLNHSFRSIRSALLLES
jgi:hypothetical protein